MQMRFIFRSSSFKSRDRKIIAAIDGHMCFPSNLICVVYTSVGIAGNCFDQATLDGTTWLENQVTDPSIEIYED